MKKVSFPLMTTPQTTDYLTCHDIARLISYVRPELLITLRMRFTFVGTSFYTPRPLIAFADSEKINKNEV